MEHLSVFQPSDLRHSRRFLISDPKDSDPLVPLLEASVTVLQGRRHGVDPNRSRINVEQRFENGFNGRIAVVTGGGTGMGRELVRQLLADGCDVATCDVMEDNLSETAEICAADDPAVSSRLLTFVADVSNEEHVLAFRDAVARWRPHVNLLFNNAGIGGGGSIVDADRAEWDKTFSVCWNGVYFNTRAFMPLLLASPAGHVINTSSVNGFWASLGPNIPHTAYSAAKFAVKGFTEALITDFRMNAPHLRASVVMPGHIGTSIAINSRRLLGSDPKEMTEEQIAQVRERLTRAGLDVSGASDEDLRIGIQAQGEAFRDNAPMTAAEAAAVILDGVRKGAWRILVGDDAVVLDEMVRAHPEDAYLPDFMDRVHSRGALRFTTGNLD
jgi:NAD(P)-dependent dehydrogenase (short-subunit alcohol dehydrogenase family)